jgi:alpha-methylacyl-CoA racemase
VSRPLSDVRVVELAGLGPGPFACMLFADLGADVVRVVRRGEAGPERRERLHTLRSRTIVEADLKDLGDLASVRELIRNADVLVEPFRPGVLERIGLDPADLIAENPGLIVARMTGWGQTGPWAKVAGHDINYLAITGALHAIGPAERPVQPLNLVADLGGGAMFLVTGVLAALHERSRTGAGQVIDVSMVDGASMLIQDVWRLRAEGTWTDSRASNFNDGASPSYRVYECADGRFVAVGALEPQFYAMLIAGLGLDASSLPDRGDRANWPELAERIGEVFRSRSRAHWQSVFDGTDACVTPVLALDEVADHPQISARGTVVRRGSAVENDEAPRFSASARRPWTEEDHAASAKSLSEAAARWASSSAGGPRVAQAPSAS